MVCVKNSKNMCSGFSWCVCGLISQSPWLFLWFLGMFLNCKKPLLALARPSVHLPVHVVHRSCHWTDFHELSYLSTYRKSVEKIQVSLKLYKNNRHFTCSTMYIFDHILLSSSYNEKFFR